VYSDPILIRDHPVRVYFNEQEAKLVDALTDYTGEQRAVLIRNLILDQAFRILSGEADYPRNLNLFEESQQAPRRAERGA
jgi:Mg/Co/Ni transporter MgtE